MTMPSMQEYLEDYAKGWIEGDAVKILASCNEDFEFVDAAVGPGRFSFEEFPGYLDGVKAEVLRNLAFGVPVRLPIPFMQITHVATLEIDDDKLVACCWWEIPGSGIAGTGLIHVGKDGVVRETVNHQG